MKAIAEIGLHAEPKTKSTTCGTHGDYESRCLIGSIWSKCPTCCTEAHAKDRADVETRDREHRLQVWKRKIGDAGIPERFRDRHLHGFVVKTISQGKALKFAKAYADNFDDALKTGRSVLFLGNIGTGKTHLAVGIGMQIMQRDNRSVLFTTVMRAIRRVKDTWRRDSSESETDAISALVFPDLLILDEVGVQFGSNAEKLILFDVLNERYEKRRPTLLLSNLTIDDRDDGTGRMVPGIKSFLGERIFDRLREDGGEYIVFDWESYRGEAA